MAENQIALELVALIDDALQDIRRFAKEASAAFDAVEAGDEGAVERLQEALHGLTQSYSALGDRARQAFGTAGVEAEKVRDLLEDAAEEVQGLDLVPDSFVSEIRQATQDLERMSDELESSGKRSKEAQKILKGLTEQTRQAGEQGIESGQRLTRAFEAAARSIDELGDEARIADVVLQELGESPAENLGRVQSEGEETLVTLAQLANAVKRLGEESGEGIGSFADNAAKARLAISELTEQMERQGDQASPAIRRELRRLEDQYERTFETGRDRVVKLERELEQIERETRQMLGGLQGATADVQEVLDDFLRRFPRLSKLVGAGAASIAIFNQSYSLTRQTIDLLNESLGVNLDLMVQQSDLIEKTANLIVNGFNSAAFEQIEATEAVANQRRVLIALGEDFVDTEEGIAEAFERIGRARQDLSLAQLDARRLFDELRGFSSDDFAAEVQKLVKLLPLISESLRDDPETFAAVEEQIKRLLTQARRLGDSIDADLVTQLRQLAKELEITDPLIDEMRLSLEALGITGPESIQATVDQLLNYIGAVGDARGATEEQLGLIIGKIDEVLGAIRSLPADQQDAFDETAAQLESLRGHYSQFTEAAIEEVNRLVEAQKEAFAGLDESVSESLRSALDQLRQLRAEAAQGADAGVELDPDQLRQQRDQLQAELDKLEAKPLLDLEDLNRIDELKDGIFEVSGLLADLPSPTFEQTRESGEILSGVIRELVADNEAFATGFAALDRAGRETVGLILQNYDQMAQLGRVNEVTVQRLGMQLQSVFERAGVDTANLNGLLSELQGETQTVGDLLAQLDEQVEESPFRRLEEDAKAAAGEYQFLTGEQAKVLDKTEAVSLAVKKQSDDVSDLAGNVARAGDTWFDLGAEVERVDQVSGSAAANLGAAADAGEDMATAAAQAAVETPAFVDALREVPPPAGEAETAYRGLLDALGEEPSLAALEAVVGKLGQLRELISGTRTDLTGLLDLVGNLESETEDLLV